MVDGNRNRYSSIYYKPDLYANPVIPSAKESHLLKMVTGYYGPFAFITYGYSNYKSLERILNEKIGTNFTDYSAILDWGCGCVRLTSHVVRMNSGISVYGCDIFQELVDYCARVLPSANFVFSERTPPIKAYSTNQFDLIIGMSVFSHLTEELQFRWLDELKRISTPNAILLLSVHAENSMAYARFFTHPKLFSEWSQKGFADAGRCRNLDRYLEDKEYYRNTLHSTRYIREKWSEYFEVVDVVGAANARHQSVVVLRNTK